jgi:hypothetical protein
LRNLSPVTQKDFNKSLKDMNADLRKLAVHKEKALGSEFTIDLMFLVDCTKTMNGWSKSIRLSLQDLIDTIKCSLWNSSKIRVGFLGYRDIGDESQFEI